MTTYHRPGSHPGPAGILLKPKNDATISTYRTVARHRPPSVAGTTGRCHDRRGSRPMRRFDTSPAGALQLQPGKASSDLATARRFEDAVVSMKRSDTRAAILQEVARFETEVRQLALEIARSVLRQALEQQPVTPFELARPARRDAAQPARRELAPPPRRVSRRQARQADPQPAPPPEAPTAQTELPLTEPPPASQPEPASPSDGVAAAAPEPPPAPPPSAAPAAGDRKRVAWTRESIINELATWVLSGTAIDAQFMTRHGPPGLVAATRRIFGRFDAALNVAALHVSKLYPDGPPTR